ncbi:hypothetical protein GXP67_25785 [Rhodocytophaga rosea]|uniref:DNA topoisomerase (ATP-hydrolyzing) n=1 Tax=Rhodocytophaga rosea TaxID=2704465 RepID=A0A6C0GQC8_9BACT|nr:hypothetical protein [Rhodocytophaga rosea]QHT69813.1 hypothetical protein GXP67_25785 [Rhodocytophaga rosea]
MTDLPNRTAFEESVRKRPKMYIGDDHIRLFEGLFIECIELCQIEEIMFEINIIRENKFSLGLSSPHNLKPFLDSLLLENTQFRIYLLKVLKIISEEFEIATNPAKTEILFSFDKNVINDLTIDYFKLSEKMHQLALLNRKAEILIIDKRGKYVNQNYYHFPQGVFYLFDRAITEALGNPEFKITFDGEIGSNKYQIGLAYRTDWYPTPNVISFANDVHTICGGSLVEGILEGLIKACRIYVKENNLTTLKIRIKKFVNGFILVCAVRGDNFIYGGNFKETLEDTPVREQSKQLMTKLVLDFLKSEKEKADIFLWRFDPSKLMSKIF